MTVKELEQLRKRIIATITELQESDIYLEEATQPIAPSVALGRLTRMEAIGEKSVNEARHIKVKQRLEGLGNALQRMDEEAMAVVSAAGTSYLSVDSRQSLSR